MKYRGSWFNRMVVNAYNKIFGSDNEDRAGVGPFSLPLDHPFTRAAAVHDFYFVEARNFEAKGRTLDMVTLQEADEKLFRAFARVAMNAPTLEERLELMLDVCVYWPAARKVGLWLWQGPKEGNL